MDRADKGVTIRAVDRGADGFWGHLVLSLACFIILGALLAVRCFDRDLIQIFKALARWN